MIRYLKKQTIRKHRRIWNYLVLLMAMFLITYIIKPELFNVHFIFNELNGMPLKMTSYNDVTMTASENAISEKAVFHGPLPFDFKYSINHVDACNSPHEIVVIVTSARSNKNNREVIRKTWGSNSVRNKYNFTVLFLFGLDHEKNDTSSLRPEDAQHHDVIEANFIDSYDNLTLKSLAMLNWFTTYCQNAKYLLKCDDDVYVNFKVLTEILKNVTYVTKFVVGQVQPIIPVIREDDRRHHYRKWALSEEEYSDKFYPAYIQGSAYVISGSAVPSLYGASNRVHFVRIEDVFITGFCANMAGIRRLHMRCIIYPEPKYIKFVAFGKNLSPKLIEQYHKRMMKVKFV